MRLVRLQWGLALLLAIGCLGVAPVARAAVSYNVGVCDPKTTVNCLKPNADGSINIVGTISLSNYALETGGNLAASKADLDSIVSGLSTPVPLAAGSQIIGKAGIDQTTPGTTNNVTISTNVGTLPLVQATASAAISSTAAGGPTQLIAASGSTKIYVTHYDLVVSGAGTFAWVTGTGTNCGTGTTYLTGASGHPLSFAANGGVSAGGGLGPILITGAGGELCYITTGAVDISGSVAYAQF